jgi:hypothetical protein
MEYPMAHENSDAKRHDRGKITLHHKFHNGLPAGGADEAHRDNDDMQPSEGQPEIPKVGSRDAPGG